jgi:hypothetical protein
MGGNLKGEKAMSISDYLLTCKDYLNLYKERLISIEELKKRLRNVNINEQIIKNAWWIK